MSTTLTFSIFAVIFLATGIVLYVMSDQIEEIVVQYDNVQECIDVKQQWDDVTGHPKTCTVDLHEDGSALESTIKSPIYVYYQLDNFYQNHRRYVKSRDNEQLFGQYKDASDLSTCDPIVNVSQLWTEQQFSNATKKAAWDNGVVLPTTQPGYDPLDGDLPAVPCGLVAKSFFNDTYKLCKYENEGDCDNSDNIIEIKEENIAWSSDVQFKFKNLEMDGVPSDVGTTWDEVQWLDMEDEHFIVWMRTAGLPNFRKLWGKIETDLEAAQYKVIIENNYAVDTFQGKKYFVLSTTNALGGKNYFLAVCYIVVGTLCCLFAFIFCIAYMRKRNMPGTD